MSLKQLIIVSSICFFNYSLLGQANQDIILLDVNEQLKEYVFPHKYAVIIFFSSRCGPCIRELKTLSEKSVEWTGNYNVEILGVSSKLSIKSVGSLRRFKRRNEIEIPLFVDINNGMTDKLYSMVDDTDNYFYNYKGGNLASTPQTYILKNGEIVYHKKGFKKGDELIIESYIMRGK